MSNTIAGMTNENVAVEGLDAFVDGLVPITAFSTDLSGDAALQGTVVKTRIVPAIAGTVGDLTDDHTGSYVDAIDDVTFAAVSVTLGDEPVIGWHWTDTEFNNLAAGVFNDSDARLVRGNSYAVSNKVLDVLFAAVDATYPTGATVTAANFDADDVADLRDNWVSNGGRMGPDVSMTLNASYYAALLKDNAIQDKSASGIDAVLSGVVPRAGGFRVIEAPSLAGAAAANTTGFIAHPSGMAIAMRGKRTQAMQDFLAYRIVTHEETGITLTFASWFDREYRKVYNTFETLWGRADAVTTSIRRIISS